MKKQEFKDRMRYTFDNIMSLGTVSMVGILFAITAAVVILAGLCMVALDGEMHPTVGGSIWISLMHAIDAGTLTADKDSSFVYMLLMTLVTICGLFITSVLFGIVSTGMRNKMESLRKGKSRILESDHTVILGFNRNTYILLNELIEANANQKKGVVVIMDEHMEKEAMEEAIHLRFPDTGNTWVICRQGNIADLADLHVCSPETARCVIINCLEDFDTIKSILAVTTLLKRKKSNRKTYLTAVIQDRENYEAAQIAADNRAEILFFDDTIARIVAQASRQPGLSAVYTELFNYSGDEIYIEEIPGVTGLRMRDLNLYFDKSTVLGIERKNGVHMNPDGDMKVEGGDKLILLAEDDGVTQAQTEPAEIDEAYLVRTAGNSPECIRRLMILGYGPRLGKVLEEEDAAMAEGSEILIAVQPEYEQQARDQLLPSYKHIRVELQTGDLYHKHRLGELLWWKPESILVLNSLQADAREDDNRTLLILLQLRAALREKNLNCPITSEMRDVENQELAQITEVRDFVISSHITSLMVAHIAQCRELNEIFTGLLTDAGAEIYMRPAGDYVELGRPVSLYTACAAATLKNQVFLGYRRRNSQTGQLEVFINQEKNTMVHFDQEDCFVVLADD